MQLPVYVEPNWWQGVWNIFARLAAVVQGKINGTPGIFVVEWYLYDKWTRGIPPGEGKD